MYIHIYIYIYIYVFIFVLVMSAYARAFLVANYGTIPNQIAALTFIENTGNIIPVEDDLEFMNKYYGMNNKNQIDQINYYYTEPLEIASINKLFSKQMFECRMFLWLNILFHKQVSNK